MAKLLPILIVLIGLIGGAGAGYFLKPSPEPEAEIADATAPSPPAASLPPLDKRQLARLNNQFFVPVIQSDRVTAMMALSLTLEVAQGYVETALSHEPRLRDAFLQVMFDHANIGGFDGTYTRQSNMTALRTALRETGRQLLGPSLIDVLITDIIRQDS